MRSTLGTLTGLFLSIVFLSKDIYTNSSMTVHLHKESNKINTRRGVRQGVNISPDLFTATLESIFRRLIWKTYAYATRNATGTS